jgi:hypothetical protein
MTSAVDNFTPFDENSLFAANLDDLADLPSFETPPEGSYILTVSLAGKKINNKDAVEAAFEVVESVELADAADTPVAPGTKFSQAFFLDNVYAVGNFKKLIAPLGAHFGISNIGELVRETQNITVAATVKNRKDKNDATKVYASVVINSVM